MTTHTTTVLVDDLNGTEDNVTTVPFGLDGVHYEIDLSDKNADELRDFLDRYVVAGRRIGGRQTRRRTATRVTGPARTPAKRDPSQSKQMREWLRANGWPNLKDRGRIPDDAEAAYHSRAGR